MLTKYYKTYYVRHAHTCAFRNGADEYIIKHKSF